MATDEIQSERSRLIDPHGREELVDLMVPEDEIDGTIQEAVDGVSIPLSERKFWDLQLIGHGVYTPLAGFMNEDDYISVRDESRLSNGTVWTLPITLPVSEQIRNSVANSDCVLLEDPAGEPAGIIAEPEIYRRDLKKEVLRVYRTEEKEHPGVKNVLEESPWVVSGEVKVFNRPFDAGVGADDIQLWPDETREEFARRGWKRIVGFQTRNPMHRAHEYLVRCAMELTDGAMIHPLVGPTKSSDIPADVRMSCYRVILDKYYPEERTLLNLFPAPMRYGGPREAIFHSLCRKNYGCSHFIVGRDHAGVGDYYGTYEAQEIFSDFPSQDIGITPLFFEFAFHCGKCDGMATAKTCPHDPENHLFLSGTKVRQRLREGKDLPHEFTRPEVAEILRDHYQDT